MISLSWFGRHATLAVFVAASSPACADPIDAIKGAWVSETSGSVGEPVVFSPAFAGYDASIPQFPGLSSVQKSQGEFGSHIKVESKTGQVCFYYVAFTFEGKMTWAYRGGAGDCPASAEFARQGNDGGSSAAPTSNDMPKFLDYIGPSLDVSASDLNSQPGTWSIDSNNLPYFSYRGQSSLLGRDTAMIFSFNADRSAKKEVTFRLNAKSAGSIGVGDDAVFGSESYVYSADPGDKARNLCSDFVGKITSSLIGNLSAVPIGVDKQEYPSGYHDAASNLCDGDNADKYTCTQNKARIIKTYTYKQPSIKVISDYDSIYFTTYSHESSQVYGHYSSICWVNIIVFPRQN